MATGNHLHFLLPRKVWGSPSTSPPHPTPVHRDTHGWHWWKLFLLPVSTHLATPPEPRQPPQIQVTNCI